MNPESYHYALPAGTMVREYRIVKVLGQGSFGIVYKAEHRIIAKMVALKEFLPSNLACRLQGQLPVTPLSSKHHEIYCKVRDKFLDEAKTLWKVVETYKRNNIVRINDCFEENDSIYIVMDLEEGRSLEEILRERGTLPEGEITAILDSLLDGLDHVHAAKVLHRDIKPSNILIRPDGSPVLIDFGAARQDLSNSDRSTIAQISPNYAAYEQIFPEGEQGPWTDIYAMGATVYRAITGMRPVNATDRKRGAAYIPAKDNVQSTYSPSFLKAVDAALMLHFQDRPHSIDQWRGIIAAEVDPTVLRPRAAPTEKIVADAPLDEGADPLDEGPDPLDERPDPWDERPDPLDEAPDPSDQGPDLSAPVFGGTPKEETTGSNSLAQKIKESVPARMGVMVLLVILIASVGIYQIVSDPDRRPDIENNQREVDNGSTGNQPIKIIYPAPTSVKAQLQITSVPGNAQVFVDGRIRGTTPLDLEVDTGKHSLRFSLNGHYDWQGDILIEDRGDIPLRIALGKKQSL